MAATLRLGGLGQMRPEPGRLPAAILAMLVHAGFFTLIVFGVSWQVKHPPQVVAELWDQLPPLAVPEPPPPPEPVVKTEPDERLTVTKSAPVATQEDIALKARKEKEEKEREAREKAEKKKQAELEKKRKDEEAAKKAAKAAEDRARAEQAAREEAAATARNAALQDYASRIRALITGRANIPDTVSGKPVVQVRLRLLVNGAVFDAQVVKPSGNRTYDEAVQRAVNGIQNWPLPQNAELFGGRRELILNIEHER
ncbi:MAG TPA: energy transducer TonB [Usitatibacteraceae bacterium]|nr:energy transducer TonB [Usitatibacteraceae bacterium]